MAAANLFDAAKVLYEEDLIEEEEFLLLVNEAEDKAPVFPYWSYQRFCLESVNEDECLAEFRFKKEDLQRLVNTLQIPDKVICRNGTTATKLEALCVLLRRFAYPCRYSDLIPRFGRSKPELCLIVHETMRHVLDLFGHLLTSFNQPLLRLEKLQEYARATYEKSKALDNCWGFIDGTVRPICRPGENQKILYNGHKRVHALKYQSVVTASGMIANLYGPVEGRRHDAGMLRESGLGGTLEQHCNTVDGDPLCLYGDPAYPQRPHLQRPYKGNNLTDAQQNFNKAMSKVRVSVEWVFGEILEYFAFVDFKKSQKIGLSEVGNIYKVCALLHNARTCLYGSSTASFMETLPITLEEYFQPR